MPNERQTRSSIPANAPSGRLILASDFPASESPRVVAAVTSATAPKVAWIPPTTRGGRERFEDARRRFARFGITVELCDIDESPDTSQLAALAHYDAVYLTGGDPLVFQRNLRRHELGARLRDYLAKGGVIVAASGGAMQLTPNLSLFRMLSTPRQAIDAVLARRGDWPGLGFVDYELLPHFDRLAPDAIELVRRYSERIPTTVFGVPDASAILHVGDEPSTLGPAVRFCEGKLAALPSGARVGRGERL